MKNKPTEKWQTFKPNSGPKKRWSTRQRGMTTFLIVTFLVSYYVFGFSPNLHQFNIFDAVAPRNVLLEQFERVVFENDDDSPNYSIRKWRAPMRVAKIDQTDFDYTPIIEKHLVSLASITGLNHKLIQRLASPNVFMRFTGSEDIKTMVKYSGRLFSPNIVFPKNKVCVAVFTYVKGEVFKSSIIVTEYKKIGDPEKRSLKSISGCILEELTQSMGLPGDNELIRPSLFSRIYPTDQLSINDKIIIRTLYDDRLVAGMAKVDAMPIVINIIDELIAAVNERGEEALYQQVK